MRKPATPATKGRRRKLFGMNVERRQLGSFGMWLWVRSFLILLALLLLPGTLRGGVDLFDALFLLMLLFVVIKAHPVVYGFANDKGVYFRRYLRLQFVLWETIGAVDWDRFHGLSIHLRDVSPLRRTLQFVSNPSVKEFITELSGRSTPEIVPWLHETLTSAHPSAVSIEPQQTENKAR